jgi:Asp-tRNA(Asn)/Glu-tRNA(Gln) amidotransferase A subunit family amidase
MDRSPPAAPFYLEKAKLAFCKTPGWSLVGSGTRSAWETSQALLRRAGATVSDLELPAEFSNIKEWHLTVLASEAHAAFLGSKL